MTPARNNIRIMDGEGAEAADGGSHAKYDSIFNKEELDGAQVTEKKEELQNHGS